MRKNILLCICTSLLLMAVAEVVFRCQSRLRTYPEKIGAEYVSPYVIASIKKYHLLIANKSFSFHRREFTTSGIANNEGLKDKNFTTDKQGKRIIMLGDSYTEGIGADNDSSMPKQLSYLIRDSFDTTTEVWNAGISGSDPFYEYVLLKDKLLKYQPDMVIVVINNSDLHDALVRGGFERFHADGTVSYRRAPWFEPLFAHSYLVRKIVLDVFHYNWEFIKPSDVAAVQRESYAKLESAIDSFDVLCTARHIPPLFVFHPGQPNIENVVPYDMKPLIAYCDQEKYPYVDLYQRLNQLGIDSSSAHLLFWREDAHCNNKGYAYFARGIYPMVASELKK